MYYVYVLQCVDDSLYTGVSNDLDHRLKMHRDGRGSKYVRSRLPFKLVYKEKQPDKSTALQREAEIKNWTHTQKLKELQLGTSGRS